MAAAQAVDALSDFKKNEGKIPPLYKNLFRSSLYSQLQHYSPSTAAQLLKESEELQADGGDQTSISYLTQNTTDISSAAAIVRRGLSAGRDPGADIIYFLKRLQKENPAELRSVLASMIVAEERVPGSISARTLSWTSAFFLSANVPPELQQQFLSMCLRAVRDILQSADSSLYQEAYGLLIDILPTARQISPASYSLASAQLATLSTLIPESQLSRNNLWDEGGKSPDPVEDLIRKSGEAEDAQLKDALLTQAAQAALGMGQFKAAIDLAVSTTGGGDQQLWRDQFLLSVNVSALEAKDVESAEYASSKIRSPLNRAVALQKIASHFSASNDLPRALSEAAKSVLLITESEDNAEKVSTALRLIPDLLKIDHQQTISLVRAVIKTADKLIGQNGKQKDADPTKYVEQILHISWNLIPAFQSLAQKDQAGTLALLEDIKSQELKVAALFGSSTGALLRAERRPKSQPRAK